METQTNSAGTAPAPVAKQNMQQILSVTPASKIPSLPEVEERFTKLAQHIQGVPPDVAKSIFHAETFHYLKLINENQAVRECDPLSLYGCFVDMAVNGLSFDPSKKLCYIIPGNVNIGTKENPVWTKRAALSVSPYGELAIRQRCKQIKYADNPIIVYEGDEFRPFVSPDGKKRVEYALNMNHSKTIVGAFIQLTRIDGSTDTHWLLREDIERLKGYSAKKNKGYANALYNSQNEGIDPGFLGAKMIKHAFKSYPKTNVAGSFAKLEPEENTENLPENLYGFDPNVKAELPAATNNQQALSDAGEDHQAHELSNITQHPGASHEAKAAFVAATAPSGETHNAVLVEDKSSGIPEDQGF